MLNHELVRAVLTERLTSDYDVKCPITFSFQWKFHVHRTQFRVENQNDDFVKVMQDSTECFHLLRFYIPFSKISRARDFGAPKRYGSLEKI